MISLAGLASACRGAGPPAVKPGEPSSPPPLPVAAAIDDLVISATGSCAIFKDRTARCWGVWDASMIKVTSAASGLADIAELRVGHTIKLDPQRYFDHLCARDTQHRIQCWGNNQQHQLGADVSGDAPTPTAVDVSGVTQLALGAQHSCALTAQGDVWCWGSNEYGQAGAGKATAVVARPRKVAALPPIAWIAAGSSNTCAATHDERVYCWGQNRNEQSTAAEPGLERRSREDQEDGREREAFEPEVWTPREVGAARGTQRIAAGRSTLCGIKADASIVCWGFVRALLGEPYAKRSSGQVPGLQGVKTLGLGDRHACALLATGEVWCFGIGERGELGNGEAAATTAAPTRVALPAAATQLTVGAQSACARLDDNRWLCWGANKMGELDAARSPIVLPAPLDLTRVDFAG